MHTALDKGVEHNHCEKFWDEVNVAFAKLRSNSKAWKQEQAERVLWDITLGDGIDKD